MLIKELNNKMNGLQTISVFYSPDIIANMQLFEELVIEAKDKHYSIVMGFFRHMALNLFSPKIVECVYKSVEICHRYGLKYTLEADATWWGYILAENNPECALIVTKQADGHSFNGNFDVTTTLPRVALPHHQTVFNGISAVYMVVNGVVQYLPAESLLEFHEEYSSKTYGFPSQENFETYEANRSIKPASLIKIKGRLPSEYTGKIKLYIDFRDYSHVYFGHSKYLKKQRELLELYQDIPLDGIGWDEACRSGDMTSYKIGEGFYEYFRERKGYDLRERLIYLDNYQQDPLAIQTRYDYYQVLTGINYRAQNEFNQYARELFGANIIQGIHQTWSGLAKDMRGGCFDYFNLGKLLSDSYTDSSWFFPRELIYQFFLSDSLRKELKLDNAYSNDWGGVNTIELTNYHTRLKLLFNLNWVTMYMGTASEGLPNYPKVDVWKDTGHCVKLLDDFNMWLGNDTCSEAHIAIWHGWEPLAYMNNWYVRLYHMAISNMSVCFLEQNIYFDFISTYALEATKLNDSKSQFFSNGKSYDILIVPYPVALPNAAWKRLQYLIKNKIKVVFFGPPTQWAINPTKNISSEFCKVAGISKFDSHDYFQYYSDVKPIGDYVSQPEPDKVDFCYPIVPVNAEALIDCDGNTYGVSNGNVSYLPMIDPRQHLIDHVTKLTNQKIRIYSKNIYCRSFISKHDNELILVAISKLNQHLDGIIRIGDIEININGGHWTILKFIDMEVNNVISDDGVNIKINGKFINNNEYKN